MDIFTFTNYREFLNAYYKEQKAKKRHFSFRYFSRVAELKGNNYLQMVMDGKRNLTPATISKFIKALRLNKKEGSYFENLVLFNQAKSEQERDLYFDRLVALKPSKKITGLTKDEFEYLSKKHLVVIREMVSLPHFKEDPEWIAKQFKPFLSKKEVSEAIETLLRLSLLKRNEDGVLKLAKGAVITPPESDSLEIFNYHRAVLSEAKEAILNVQSKKRETVSMTIPMPMSSVDGVKDIIRKCQEEIVQYINKGSRNFDDVFQVNIQMFPVTHSQEKEDNA